MKYLLSVLLILALLFTACAPANPQEPTLQGNLEVDETMFEENWEAFDMSDYPDMQSYRLYYTKKDSANSYVVLTLSPHYEDAGEDLLTELKKNVEMYTQETLPLSTAECTIGELEYTELGGFPACSFELTAKVGTLDDEFTAKNLFVSTQNGIYCLQMQSLTEDFEENREFFEKLQAGVEIK